MKHMAYPSAQSLGPKVTVQIIGTPIIAGEQLVIEYPNNKRDSAKVISSGPNILEISVGDTQWRLTPLAPHETVGPTLKADGMAIVAWVIQPT